MHPCGGPPLSQLGKTACAISLALSRYQLLAPSVLPLIVGHFSFGPSNWAHAEGLPVSYTLYNQAQNGHLYLTSCVVFLLEAIIIFLLAIYLAIIFSPFTETLGAEFRKTWLTILNQTLEKAGPTFIKWGQWAATRPDLFPQDICSELAKLHSHTPSHSFCFLKENSREGV